MSIAVEAIFKVIAYTVPAIMVVGGILLLLFGYPLNHEGMIISGWALILFGGFIYIVEIIAAYYSNR